MDDEVQGGEEGADESPAPGTEDEHPGRNNPGGDEPSGIAPSRPAGAEPDTADGRPPVELSRRSLVLGGGVAGLGLLAVGAAIGWEFGSAGPDGRDVDLVAGTPDATTGTRSQGSATARTDGAAATTGHREAGTDGSTGDHDRDGGQGNDHQAGDDGDDQDGDAPPVRRFTSTDLTVPAVTSWRVGPVTPGLIFIAQKNDRYRGAIIQESGEPVWIDPTGANMMDLQVQTFDGEPVLTYWSGEISRGHGRGHAIILDASYTPVATVRAGNGVQADLHEFKLTDAGTALITAYPTAKADLRAIGGPADGYIYDCHAQEVDVRTGAVLLDWVASQHIPIDETYLGLQQIKDHDGTTEKRAFDPYHLNAIDDDGDRLLLSVRHTHAIYAIDRTRGTVRWRFGGKRSDFQIPADAVFAWQHDVRRLPDGTITLFDNHYISTDDGGHSRGLRFRLDERARTSTMVAEYHYDQHLAPAMGSTQILPNGNALLGWGSEPSMTEFTADGRAVYQAALGGRSYRAARHPWVGRPATRPSIAARREKHTVRVWLSWNGATEVARWRIRSGQSADELDRMVTTVWSGFETTLRIAPASHVAAEALDSSDRVLGSTDVVTA